MSNGGVAGDATASLVELTKDGVNDTVASLSETVANVSKSSAVSLSTFARTFFKISATTLSVAFASLVGFVVYRSNVLRKKSLPSTFHTSRSTVELQEPNICRSKLSAEQIEEVRDSLHSTEVVFFSS